VKGVLFGGIPAGVQRIYRYGGLGDVCYCFYSYIADYMPLSSNESLTGRTKRRHYRYRQKARRHLLEYDHQKPALSAIRSPQPDRTKKKCPAEEHKKRLFKLNLTETEMINLFKKNSLPVT
jgi:hypothetical protein